MSQWDEFKISNAALGILLFFFHNKSVLVSFFDNQSSYRTSLARMKNRKKNQSVIE